MSQIRVGFVALAVVPAIVASAIPASALASASVATSCGYSQSCLAFAQSVPQVGTGTSVEAACSALTSFDVQATIVRCYILGNNGDQHWAPATITQGRSSSLSHSFDAWSLKSNVYQVCTGAGYFSTAGTYYGPTNYKCGTVI